MASHRPPAPEIPDLSEKGRTADGGEQSLDRRLFMQLLVFDGVADAPALVPALEAGGVCGALYADVANPRGVGLLTITEDPAWLVTGLRPILQGPLFAGLELQPGYTMMGRTYSIGYEQDLVDTLLQRPRRTALNPAWPWAVWYPLRRIGEFERLEPSDQRRILGEHGSIGRAFGAADLAHDIRLAGHGMMESDNDFVVALVGKELHPLSAVVQRMRKTEQTSRYMDEMGPFFVGHAIWQSAMPAAT